MIKFLISFFIFSYLFLSGCGPTEKDKQLMRVSKRLFKAMPDKMPGSENDTPELIALGKKLYHEKRLSINDKQSCSTCHILEKGKAAMDNLPTSPGAIENKIGTRNTPTALNSGFQFTQFWDGRAKDLKEQAKGPILNPLEMAMPSEKAVIEKIKKIKEYQELFAKAYKGQKNPITYDNLAGAIAAFERTFISKTRFNDFILGDHNALTEKEKQGARLFLKLRCTQCHETYILGGTKFQKMGQEHLYENKKDMGRYDVTKKEKDKYVFKVPPLLNVALTAPYFHDGKVLKLEEAVKKIAYLQLDKKISDQQAESITDFLKALTDKKLEK